MSYLTGQKLTEDVDFGRRSRFCLNNQAGVYINDQRKNFVSLARAIIMQDATITQTFMLAICQGAQFDSIVDNGDGTIDSAKLTDADIQSRVDSIWEEISLFYFDPTTGDRLPNTGA